MTSPKTFSTLQSASQTAYFATHLADVPMMEKFPYRLAAPGPGANLAPALRGLAERYFERPDGAITWHRHANHALSSQVCCLNFLMPFAEKPDLLARFVQSAVGGALPEMLPIEDGPDGRPWFIAFEWIGSADHLNEANAQGARTRGANSTSADAAVKFRLGGETHVLLIEWKYTERYGQPLSSRTSGDTGGNFTRAKRYGSIAFAPDGPLRADAGVEMSDFFWEPFYQLMRQQILADQIERHREADRARVLHLSPSGNRSLHAVTSPKLRAFGTDAFDVFRSLLVDPDALICRSIEDVFRPLLADPGTATEWADYLTTRYDFLNASAAPFPSSE